MTSTDDKPQVPPASPPAKPDARVRPRYKMDVRLRVIVLRTAEVIHARSADISEGGMALFAPMEIELGEGIALELTLPYTREAQKLYGVVRNRNGYRYGIEFRQLAPKTQQTIARVCNALSLTT